MAPPASPPGSVMATAATIAYFSMEVALKSELPTYAGGLGVLAGDTLRSAADLALPMVGVTLLHRTGYFFQRIDAEGRQHEEPVAWSPDDWLVPLDATCTVEIEGRPVRVRAWRYTLEGVAGSEVPVFLLDTDVSGNDPGDRRLTDQLYGGDDRYRLAQEVLLGVGGMRMLRALGYREVSRFHMNEGHAALLALELLAEELERTPDRRDEAIERVKRRCVFTTHTPVPAGHDQFPRALAEHVIGRDHVKTLDTLGCCDEVLNLTHVAVQLSHYVNGVTRRHGEISRSMFAGYPIGSITNGVHSVTWTSPPFARLYDRHMPDWRRNSASLRYAVGLPLEAIAAAHREAKQDLLAEVNARTNAGFDQDVFTLGFARRATPYKRPALLFHDPQRLRRLAAGAGLQIVLAGKAHPRDAAGKELIRQTIRSGAGLGAEVKVAYLENYDVHLAKRLIAGVDVWVNTPKPPLEASGTSGMKAAHNGVPSLSVLDGWWWEGHIEGVTGWAIGSREREAPPDRSDAADADDLYRVLEQDVLPLFSGDRGRWTAVMRSTIALNASFFNCQRMLQEYVAQAYYEPG
jgi:starch phosphorylase